MKSKTYNIQIEFMTTSSYFIL